jgi:hypothetical protein
MMDTQKANTIAKPNEAADFDLAVAAKNGDQAAANILWLRYRRRMMGIIGKYNYRLYQLSNDELESEAAELFMHKLKEVFKPEKVRKSSGEWSFSYMLTGGSRNWRDKIITETRKHLRTNDYDERGNLSETHPNDSVPRALEWNDWEYTKYNPEKAALENEWDQEEKIMALNKRLTFFQKAILNLRRQGMTVQQIADRMGCGFTKVRVQIIKAKQAASEVLCA